MDRGIMLWPLVMFAAAMCLTPGPNVVMVTASAANFGFRRAVPQILGITIGFGVMVMASGMGLAALLRAEPQLQTIVKYVGAAYLLYLARRIANAAQGDSPSGRTRPFSFAETALFQWMNPKGWVTAIGALATFTVAGGNALAQVSVIAAVLAAACFVSVVIWAAFGVAISRFIGSPAARARFNWSMAGLLVFSLIPVFWEG